MERHVNDESYEVSDAVFIVHYKRREPPLKKKKNLHILKNRRESQNSGMVWVGMPGIVQD